MQIDGASTKGHMDVLVWWKSGGLKLKSSSKAMGLVHVRTPHPQLTPAIAEKKIGESGCSLSRRGAGDERAMDSINGNGLVHVLDWWKNSGLEMKWSYLAMDYGSKNGQSCWWTSCGLKLKFDIHPMITPTRGKREWTR
ncbi:hypothetical protein BJ742DRAFT_899006 [Cladochytrium replicatum]|nr:hypothetical protein BJ742DRAFT_899006 [Cladochytrium replicatum]